MKTAYELFIQYLIGDFDNSQQVAEEKAAGNQVHPLAVHINRVCTDRVENLPNDFKGSYILEESYYTYPGQEMTIKPHLFYVEHFSDTIAQMRPIVIPEYYKLEELKNDNPDLRFKYEELKPIAWFNPAHYHRVGHLLEVHNPNDLGEGKRFTLTETFDENTLEVMELMEQDGKRLTPYATPIIYRRRQKSDQ